MQLKLYLPQEQFHLLFLLLLVELGMCPDKSQLDLLLPSMCLDQDCSELRLWCGFRRSLNNRGRLARMVSHISSAANIRFRVNQGVGSFSHAQIGICVLKRYIKNYIGYIILCNYTKFKWIKYLQISCFHKPLLMCFSHSAFCESLRISNLKRTHIYLKLWMKHLLFQNIFHSYE